MWEAYVSTSQTCRTRPPPHTHTRKYSLFQTLPTSTHMLPSPLTTGERIEAGMGTGRRSAHQRCCRPGSVQHRQSAAEAGVGCVCGGSYWELLGVTGRGSGGQYNAVMARCAVDSVQLQRVDRGLGGGGEMGRWSSTGSSIPSVCVPPLPLPPLPLGPRQADSQGGSYSLRHAYRSCLPAIRVAYVPLCPP